MHSNSIKPRIRHLLTVESLSPDEIRMIFRITRELKARRAQGIACPFLAGRVLALLFEKPSLRTRVSFEAGIAQLGGTSLYLGAETGFGKRESSVDFARVLGQYVDLVVIRAFSHETVVTFAQHAGCSVINGLTDHAHPCQALADLYTIEEHFGTLEGQTIAWVGDGNNVARSLAMGCAKLGVRLIMATPSGYRFSEQYVSQLRQAGMTAGPEVVDDPVEAVRQASVVYTDVWTSMGQEAETEERRRVFAPYQVNSRLMSFAPKQSVFMHCMPAHRGEEVTDEVIDGPQSIVVIQAANRMHVQKGIMVWLLNLADALLSGS